MEKLKNRNIVVYDLEICNVIDGQNVTRKDFDKMGISVGCLYDYRDGDWKVYMKDNIHKLAERIMEADTVVAFNQLEFDDKLLQATPEAKYRGISFQKQYDMLHWSRISCGFTPGIPRTRPTGLKLDDHLLATFGPHAVKTANGAEAPLMWQQGRIGELVSYCLADVRREKMLFEHIVQNGWVKTPTHGQKHVECRI